MASALGAAALGGLGLLRAQPLSRAPRPAAAPRPHHRRARARAAAAAAARPAPAPAAPPAAHAEDSIFPDLDPLPVLEPSSSSGSSPNEFRVDVAVAGAGPAGLAVAARVAAAGFSVAVVDPAPLAAWPNNYGVWCDEFEAMGLEDCFATVWPSAVVHLDAGPLGARTLTRPYARVDRPRLKRRLLADCLAAGVRFHVARVEGGAAHAAGRSTLSCRAAGAAGEENAASTVVASLVVDATGHARRLVQHDRAYNPGYQGAYGFTAEVESHPFDPTAMLFMDWRDEHLAALPELRASNAK
jgi:lycopene beta-cyclase